VEGLPVVTRVASLEDLPPLPPAAGWLLVGVAVCAWVLLRVGILRRRQALRAPGEAPPKAPAWLVRLAAWRGTTPLFGTTAIALGAAAAWLLTRSR
jgi:hypothetical protein